jgi:putative (di)nucleoside polyphosphate hydrolase
LPKYLLGKLWNGKYRGQKQKWFVMKFLGKSDEINVKTKNPEFLNWKWIELSQLSNIAVHFKVDIYNKLKEELKILNLN